MSKITPQRPHTFTLLTDKKVLFYTHQDSLQNSTFVEVARQACQSLDYASPIRNQEKIVLVVDFTWSDWYKWTDIELTTLKQNPLVPLPTSPGVYEVMRTDADNKDERLYIGEGNNLFDRVRQELIKGDASLHKGDKIVAYVNGDKSKLRVRWAVTNFQVELEALLARQYLDQFGTRPAFMTRP